MKDVEKTVFYFRMENKAAEFFSMLEGYLSSYDLVWSVIHDLFKQVIMYLGVEPCSRPLRGKVSLANKWNKIFLIISMIHKVSKEIYNLIVSSKMTSIADQGSVPMYWDFGSTTMPSLLTCE